MPCDDCQSQQAEIQVTLIVDGEMRTLDLCASCAAKRGVSTDAPSAPLADFLAQLGGEPIAAPTLDPCPFCGLGVDEFRRTGRLGCSQCYAHFEPQLRGLLRRIHGSPQHVGKLYMSAGSEAGDRIARLSAMRRRLKRAIETEDFERAAELRDEIHELEGAE